MSQYTKSSTLWKERPHQPIFGKALFVLPIFLLAMALSFWVDASVSEARFVDLSVAEERIGAQEEITKLRNAPNVVSIKSNPALTQFWQFESTECRVRLSTREYLHPRAICLGAQ